MLKGKVLSVRKKSMEKTNNYAVSKNRSSEQILKGRKETELESFFLKLLETSVKYTNLYLNSKPTQNSQ